MILSDWLHNLIHWLAEKHQLGWRRPPPR